MQKADTNFFKFNIFIYLSLFQQYKALYNQGYMHASGEIIISEWFTCKALFPYIRY